jgi:hypothetical protein
MYMGGLLLLHLKYSAPVLVSSNRLTAILLLFPQHLGDMCTCTVQYLDCVSEKRPVLTIYSSIIMQVMAFSLDNGNSTHTLELRGLLCPLRCIRHSCLHECWSILSMHWSSHTHTHTQSFYFRGHRSSPDQWPDLTRKVDWSSNHLLNMNRRVELSPRVYSTCMPSVKCARAHRLQ